MHHEDMQKLVNVQEKLPEGLCKLHHDNCNTDGNRNIRPLLMMIVVTSAVMMMPGTDDVMENIASMCTNVRYMAGRSKRAHIHHVGKEQHNKEGEQ